MERTKDPENPKSPTTLASLIHTLRGKEADLERELKELSLAFIAKALNAVREVPGFAPQPEVQSENFAPVVAKFEVGDSVTLYFSRRDYGDHYHSDGSTITKLWRLIELVSTPDGEVHLQPKFNGVRGSDIAHPYEYSVTIDFAALESGEPEILAEPGAAASDTSPPPTPATETRGAVAQVVAGGMSYDFGPRSVSFGS